jgi:Protein of unknown function (DUF3617)
MLNRLLFALLCTTFTLPALAQDYPKLKPGLWELKRMSDRPADKGQTTTICMDADMQKKMYEAGLGAMKGICSKTDFKVTGSRGVGEFVCNMNGSTMTSKSVMTINGDTGYRTEVDTTFEPPFMGQSKTHSVLEARYTGACKPGQRPGDMTLPNGTTMNMRDAIGAGAPK